MTAYGKNNRYKVCSVKKVKTVGKVINNTSERKCLNTSTNLTGEKSIVCSKRYNPNRNACVIRPASSRSFIAEINKTVPTKERMDLINRSASLFDVTY